MYQNQERSRPSLPTNTRTLDDKTHAQSYAQYRDVTLRTGRPRRLEIKDRQATSADAPIEREAAIRERDNASRNRQRVRDRERDLPRSAQPITKYEAKFMADIGRFRVVRLADLAQVHGSRYQLTEIIEDRSTPARSGRNSFVPPAGWFGRHGACSCSHFDPQL